MAEQVPEYFIQRLKDMGGCLPNGAPKNRLVFAPETFRAHGKLKGKPKYADPDTGESYKCWVWETWYPASMCGEREDWNEEFLGPYPADCEADCCNRGYWGIRTIIATPQSAYIPLTEETLSAIERKQFADVQWSMESDKSRLEQLDAALSARNKQADADALDALLREYEHYANHKEDLDNADNRVFSWGEKYLINTGKGAKEAIGSPVK